MSWQHALAYVFGGLFLANTIPHWVAGCQGKPFQSPFAKPPGQGYSSARLNVVWGGANFVVGYLLLSQVGSFDPKNLVHVACAFVPAFLLTLQTAGHFGRVNGGNEPLREQARIEARRARPEGVS